MSQQEFCKGCNQKHDCQRIYRQLADTKQPVILKVIVAFLLPIVVFIACLAIFETIPATITKTKEYHTTLGFLLASLATFSVILAVKAVERRIGNKK
jgi:hypothetical protein